jgi:hypothetical protein
MSYWAYFIKEAPLAESVKCSVDDATCMYHILDAEPSTGYSRSAILEILLSWDRTFHYRVQKSQYEYLKKKLGYIRVSLGSKIIFLLVSDVSLPSERFPVPVSSKMSIQETII